MLQEGPNERFVNLDSYRERLTNFSNEFDLGLFLFIVKRTLIWIALCVVLALSAAYIYLRYTAPVYESQSVMQLMQTNHAQKVLKISDNIVDDNNLRADVELLRSRFFMARMITRLPLTVSYYLRGQVLTTEFYTGSVYKLLDLEVTGEEVRGKPVECSDVGNDRVRLSYTVNGTTYTEEFGPDERVVMPHFHCRLQFAHGGKLEERPDGAYYFVINDMRAIVSKYRKQITVAIADPEAKTVLVQARDENPQIARDLAQAMADAFIEYDIERKSQSAQSILRFIVTQKDTVYKELRDSEARLQDFRRDNKVASLEQLSPLLLARTTEYENQLLQLKIEDNLLNEIERSSQGRADEVDVYHLIPMLVGTSYEGVLAELMKGLEALVQERERVLPEAARAHTSLIQVDRRIAIQQDLVIESIRNMRRRIASERKDIEGRIAEYDDRFLTLPGQEQAHASFQRLFNINEKYYTQLLEKEIEYKISRAGFVAENSVLESAVLPLAPISPDRPLVILTYLATGLILGFMIVLVRYLLHNNITSLNDIAKASQASIGVLGLIPKFKKEIPVSQLLVDRNPKSLVAESFRAVRTNMQFVDNSEGPKVIAVTSTISGEGKTFVVINLAGIICFSGKKVIVLDLDMRKPKIHLGFGVENVRGMSTILINKDRLENCIQQSSLPGLDFITAGPIPPNPSELVISPRMDQLVEELKGTYDVIVIDTPPVGLVTDGISVIQKADIPIYIFRADYSKQNFVQNADRLINENKIMRLTAVLNGVDVDRSKYGYNYNYGYGYGYGYGSGYGYYADKSNEPKGLMERLMSLFKKN